MGGSFFSFRKGPLGAALPATPSQRKKKKRTSMTILQLLLARRSAATTEFSGAELARLKKRTYYERQRTRWWFRNRFRNLLQCTSSTIFYENVSLGSSGSGSGSRRNKKATFFVFLFQFVCASEKGDLESPMAASCVPAEDVETWVAAKLTTTTTTTTTEETRLPCSNDFFSLFFSLSLSLSSELS
jgi:hypothetical protein